MSKAGVNGEGSAAETAVFDAVFHRLEDPVLCVRVMTMDVNFYEGMRERFSETFGSGADVIFYEMGLGYGKLMAYEMAKRGLSRLSVYRDFIDRGRRMGMGTFEVPLIKTIVSGFKGDIVVKLIDSFFAASAGKTGKAECHIVRGMIVGAANEIFGKEFGCVEEKCLSKGDRHCEFVLKRRPTNPLST